MKSHPKALPFLFLTEMWERYGFYVVQGILVLYTSQSFGFSDDKSYTISGMFISLAYISPIVGGLIADRLLGFKAAIGWGGVFLTLGYALLALSSSVTTFYLALATIVVGTGLFKPSISSLLGALYKSDDPNRDSGFTIFYIGINVGILLAGLGSGLLKTYFGWHVTFASASIGFLIGLATFAMGLKWKTMQYKPHAKLTPTKWLNKPILLLYCALAIIFISTIIQSNLLSKWLLPTFGIFLLFFITILTLRQKKSRRASLTMLNILILSSIVFWTLYWQMFLSANLFVDRLIDKNILGYNIPTTAFYTLESLTIIVFGPMLAFVWHNLNRSNKNSSHLMKFITGTALIGLAFLILFISTYFSNSQHLISPIWIVFSYLLIAIGELLLSPIGLSAVTSLSPTHLTGLMMGVWFVGLGLGGQFAGIIAKLASVPTALTDNLEAQLLIYRHAFLEYAILGFAIALILIIMINFIKKLISY